jgi:hypothetical protein
VQCGDFAKSRVLVAVLDVTGPKLPLIFTFNAALQRPRRRYS